MNWTGSLAGNGYGQMFYATKAVAAHRYSFMKANGLDKLSSKEFVCHRCDNPKCVNPEHLFLGSALDNMRDKTRKGRGNVPLGVQHGMAKLTEEAIKDIRTSKLRASELAKIYGVHPQHIRLVRRKVRVWKHV